MDQARYPEAATAFATAYERAAASRPAPQDADMLFERCPGGIWIGFIARRRGEFAAAREWLTRYPRFGPPPSWRSRAKTLRAQRELTSSQHNFAVLELDGGDLGAARQRGFLAERSAVAEMLRGQPGRSPLQFRMADIASWPRPHCRRGRRYTEAIECYTEMDVRASKNWPPSNPQTRFGVSSW